MSRKRNKRSAEHCSARKLQEAKLLEDLRQALEAYKRFELRTRSLNPEPRTLTPQ